MVEPFPEKAGHSHPLHSHSQFILHNSRAMRLNTAPSTSPSPHTTTRELHNQTFNLIHSGNVFGIGSPPSSHAPVSCEHHAFTYSYSMIQDQKTQKPFGGMLSRKAFLRITPCGLMNTRLPHVDLDVLSYSYHAPFVIKSKASGSECYRRQVFRHRLNRFAVNI